MRILNTSDVRKALPMKDVIEATKRAYAALSDGRAEVPLRASLPIAPHEATSLFMPAFVQDTESEALAVKVVSLFPKNPQRGLAFIQAAVLVLNPETGQPVALLEGSTLTAIRTGAASGAATDLLARPNSRVAAIFGAGTQGRTQLAAVCSVRQLETVWIYDPDPQRAETFIDEMAGRDPIPEDLRSARDPGQALAAADIICTATTAAAPVYDAADLKPGVHINGVGSYTLDMIENPPEMLKRAAVFVDSREAVMAEAGEIVAAINRKLLFPAELTELGEVVLGKAPGRTDDEQITFFKSVGVAVQDAMAAQLALQNAEAMNLGQVVAF
ncbi:MAG: ornithine cyclodeaminase family protein [Chloroflexi bacterium]|nr:ornithine cyclodeaminase family protein [Chloroflexota bacterium]